LWLDGDGGDLRPVVVERADVAADELAVSKEELGLDLLDEETCDRIKTARNRGA